MSFRISEGLYISAHYTCMLINRALKFWLHETPIQIIRLWNGFTEPCNFFFFFFLQTSISNDRWNVWLTKYSFQLGLCHCQKFHQCRGKKWRNVFKNTYSLLKKVKKKTLSFIYHPLIIQYNIYYTIAPLIRYLPIKNMLTYSTISEISSLKIFNSWRLKDILSWENYMYTYM